MNRYTCYFCDEDQEIEVTYWIDQRGDTAGEVYFKSADMGATMQNGTFEHPFRGTQYKFIPPNKFLKGGQMATLLVQQWNKVGQSSPEPQK